MNNVCPVVGEREVYAPVCYRSLYGLCVGDKMRIGNEELTIAGFIRDSQMNSMMASSKRFLVTKSDYERIKNQGDEEYLIEFLLKENTDTDSFADDYKKAEMYSNGPTITKPLIRMMNALSDGIMIFVILLVGIAVLLISLLCIRFITALGVEQDRKEVGMLKALGIENKHIRLLFFSKYILFSFAGAVLGFLGAGILKRPLSQKLRELYGVSDKGLFSVATAILVCILIQTVILLFIRHVLKKMEKMSTLEALFSPQWVTYMGIGDAGIRMDVRQSENIGEITGKLLEELGTDPDVLKYVALKTVSCPAVLSDGSQVNLIVETGNHSVFPVKYAEGKQPEKEGEIALSSLQAQDLGLHIGDMLELIHDGESRPAVVCGIYSDITNGGKTAKVRSLTSGGNADDQIMWSILYVSLKDGVHTEQWMKKYTCYGVDIVDIAEYVKGTYGPTIKQMEMAKLVAIGIALLIIMLVVMLFMRLMIEKKRYHISLKKALGFQNDCIRRNYFINGFIPVTAGVLGGVLSGNILGESICGQILKSFGAYGFHFVIRWEHVLLILVILMVTAAAALNLGTSEVKKIKAYECCVRKE